MPFFNSLPLAFHHAVRVKLPFCNRHSHAQLYPHYYAQRVAHREQVSICKWLVFWLRNGKRFFKLIRNCNAHHIFVPVFHSYSHSVALPIDERQWHALQHIKRLLLCFLHAFCH